MEAHGAAGAGRQLHAGECACEAGWAGKQVGGPNPPSHTETKNPHAAFAVDGEGVGSDRVPQGHPQCQSEQYACNRMCRAREWDTGAITLQAGLAPSDGHPARYAKDAVSLDDRRVEPSPSHWGVGGSSETPSYSVKLPSKTKPSIPKVPSCAVGSATESRTLGPLGIVARCCIARTT